MHKSAGFCLVVKYAAMNGKEHWTQEGRHQALPLAQALGRRRPARHDPLRARLVDGLAADVRPAGARPAAFLGDGMVRRARLRHLVPWTTRATAAPTSRGRSTSTSRTAPTTSRRASEYILKHAEAQEAAGLRHLLGRAEGRALRPAPSRSAWRGSRSTPSSGPARAARRSPSARSACPSSRPRTAGPIDRAFVHSIFNRDHPGTADEATDRGLRHRDPQARRFGAHRHLRRHVLEAAARRPGEDQRADDRDARPVRRHRELRGPARVLPPPAAPGQAVLGDGRHLARELPAEELHERVPHPARLLHAARAGITADDPRRPYFLFF